MVQFWHVGKRLDQRIELPRHQAVEERHGYEFVLPRHPLAHVFRKAVGLDQLQLIRPLGPLLAGWRTNVPPAGGGGAPPRPLIGRNGAP